MKQREMDRILLVGCPESKKAELSLLAADNNFAPMFLRSVNVAIKMIDESVRAGEAFKKVVTVSHVWEKEEDKDYPRLGSEIAKKCFDAGIPCIVFANTNGNSIFQEFLNAARRAGATRVFKRTDWNQAITCSD